MGEAPPSGEAIPERGRQLKAIHEQHPEQLGSSLMKGDMSVDYRSISGAMETSSKGIFFSLTAKCYGSGLTLRWTLVLLRAKLSVTVWSCFSPTEYNLTKHQHQARSL